MFGKPDYYLILGVSRNATPEEIRRAYFEAARHLHPDTNVAPGETEFFLEAKEAYEILSDPAKRAKYDASLPPEKPASLPIQQTVLYSRKSVTRFTEPQLVYVLLEYAPPSDPNAVPPSSLNLCLVLDRSTSMQGQNMDVVKATATQILHRLRPQDIFSVVAFSDRAEVIIPSTHIADLSRLEARIQMLRTFGGTEIFQGLESGYNEIKRYLHKSHVNHIILLTDGRTYGDEAKCMDLADETAKQGIGISGLGIGNEWNDAFLDGLVTRTGGSSMYVASPQDIQHLLMEKFINLSQVFAEEVILEFKTGKGIELRYAIRMQPEFGVLPLESPLRPGPIISGSKLKILMEFLIRPEACQGDAVTLFEGKLNFSISALPTPLPTIQLRLTRPVTNTLITDPPPQEIIEALSRLTLYQLEEQARLEASAGEYAKAAEHLQRLATNLVAQGERQLARTALIEAENIQRYQAFSKEGDKQIKYGTRALLLPPQEMKP